MPVIFKPKELLSGRWENGCSVAEREEEILHHIHDLQQILTQCNNNKNIADPVTHCWLKAAYSENKRHIWMS